MKRSVRGVIAGVCFVTWLAGAEAVAGCNWQGTALAGVFGGTSGSVLSSHFGQITAVDPGCLHSRSTVLRAQTLHNSSPMWTHTEVGGSAVLGAHLLYEISFAACSGQWSSTTLFGTRFLGLNFWLAQGISGILVAVCPPPPGSPDPPDDPCSQGTAATSTWTLADGETPSPAPLQLGFGHSRYERRPEGHIFLDEWAVLAVGGNHPTVRFASSADFRARMMERIELQVGGRPQDTTLLVIEAADHPQNHRHIPVPTVVPLDVDLKVSGRPGKTVAWFRAEVSAQGVVDRVMILESSGLAAQRHVEIALRENLELDYADEGRHRSVVFGRAAVTAAGRLSVDDAFVVVPQCCNSLPK